MRLSTLLTVLVLTTACQGDEPTVDSAVDDVFGHGDQAELELARELVRPHLRELGLQHGIAQEDFLELQVQVDELAMAHVKVQQTYGGIEVFGAQAIVHLNPDGSLRHKTDKLLSDIEVELTPTFSADAAVSVAKSTHWDESRQTAEPRVEMVILSMDDGPHLAHRVQLEAISGNDPRKPLVFVDAHTGVQLRRFNNLKFANVSGQGATNYYGTVDLELYEDSGYVYTEDHSRGDGIGTYSYRGSYNSAYYVYDTDTGFFTAGDEEAVEAHWAAQHVYDFYYDTFARDGIDGAGGPGYEYGLDGNPIVTLYVNYGNRYDNAFWSDAMYFGDGSGTWFSPLTTVDITGHEMTHGVTETEANFVYQDESGAIDESYADVFGAMVERDVFGDSSDVWWMGEDCYTPGTSGDALRYMDDPTADGQSYDHYATRYQDTADNGGVHLNSGIGNVTFYLMVEGGTHPSSADTVTAIGADAAMAIWYRALTTYLTSGTTFSDLRDAHVLSAEDLYGSASAESCGVQEAWEASGVGTVDASCANSAPTADAGADSTASVGASATVDGTGSTDPDGDSLTYRWKVISVPTGSAVWSSSIADRNAASTSFTPDVSGDYELNLRVTDPSGAYDDDTVVITAGGSNSAPTSDAGPDSSGSTGAALTLDGTGSSDPDGDSLTYRWKMVSVPSGSGVWSNDIGNRDAASTSFTPDVSGTYIANLRVTDPSGAYDDDQVSFTVGSGGNQAPTADAGADSSGTTGSAVTLDASGSSDPDGDSLTYRWKMLSVPGGSGVWSNSIGDRDAATTSFTPDVAGTYVANVRVTDPSGETDEAQVTFTITAGSGNQAPTADAGADGTGTTGTALTIDASGSTDPDGDTLTYRWKMLSVPSGSGVWSADIGNRDAATTSFTPDVAGDYSLNVRVTDPSGETDEAQVTYTVSNSGGNNPPVADAGSNQSVSLGATVQLDASGSSDADGDALTYRWKLVNAPAGSALNSNDISNRDIAMPTVVPDVTGRFTFQVTVDDGTVSTDATVRITVN